MHVIEHTYRCLLADVAALSGYSEIRGSCSELQWCLHEAPKLEKYLLGSLEEGKTPDFSMFPAELRRLASGSVLDPIKMRYLRQLLLFCYKSHATYDESQTNRAIQAFLETNRGVGNFGSSFSRASPRLLNAARRHCQSVLYAGKWREINPSHGPGASTTPKEKWSRWFDSIESVYPCSDYMCLYYNQDHVAELGELYDGHIEAKLIAVPKDSRGPRLICVHPAEAIWFQQGIRRELERAISRVRYSEGPWPRGHVHFSDQSVNGKIALLSSKSKRYATIDMKEASDRVSDVLVQALFGRWYKYFGCCRAQKLVIDEASTFRGQVIDINSYAPMGNATTFPVQSLVFWAICVASLQSQGFHQPGAVFVFGDDIIVPSETAPAVMADLESFGLLCNKEKSFYRGAFRESCGVDAFNGVNVTPIRWKTSYDAEHLTGLQSLSDMAMRLRVAGYERTACFVYCHIDNRLQRLPRKRKRNGRQERHRLYVTNDVNHGGIAEYSPLASRAFNDAYWHRDVQWFVTPVWRLHEVTFGDPPHGWNHVLESILSLERVARSNVPDRLVPRRVKLVRGWMPVA